MGGGTALTLVHIYMRGAVKVYKAVEEGAVDFRLLSIYLQFQLHGGKNSKFSQLEKSLRE